MTAGRGGARTLIVVAKAPVAGTVKTRLCPPCTAAQAAALAGAALEDTLAAVHRARADRRVLVLDGRPGPWVPEGTEVVAQRPGPFAERLDGAWADVLDGQEGPTVQIGMDTPQVTPTLLDEALDRLDDEEAVLGRALDGGWWALGLHRHLPGLNAAVPMSRADTADRQEERLVQLLGTDPGRLSLLRDVDEMTDARAVAASAPETRFAARLSMLGFG